MFRKLYTKLKSSYMNHHNKNETFYFTILSLYNRDTIKNRIKHFDFQITKAINIDLV